MIFAEKLCQNYTTKNQLSKCIFDRTYNACGSHSVDELKVSFSKDGHFYNEEAQKAPLSGPCY